MGPTQLVVSGVVSLVVYSIVLFAVYKIFQISTDDAEMKEALREIKRHTLEVSPSAPPPDSQSPEALVRAVHASYETLTEK